MKGIAWTVAVAAWLAASPGQAFDAAGVDIIGLRLGMQDADVVATLVQQGYTARHTPEVIEASTVDGRLQVALSGEHGVTRIMYVFNGRDRGTTMRIQETIVTRFGDPDQVKPMTWCRAVGRDGVCAGDQASLTFLPDVLTLILQDKTAAGP